MSRFWCYSLAVAFLTLFGIQMYSFNNQNDALVFQGYLILRILFSSCCGLLPLNCLLLTNMLMCFTVIYSSVGIRDLFIFSLAYFSVYDEVLYLCPVLGFSVIFLSPFFLVSPSFTFILNVLRPSPPLPSRPDCHKFDVTILHTPLQACYRAAERVSLMPPWTQ